MAISRGGGEEASAGGMTCQASARHTKRRLQNLAENERRRWEGPVHEYIDAKGHMACICRARYLPHNIWASPPIRVGGF